MVIQALDTMAFGWSATAAVQVRLVQSQQQPQLESLVLRLALPAHSRMSVFFN